VEHPTAEIFFNVRKFSHAGLWKPKVPVWSALHELEPYLKAFRFPPKLPKFAGVHFEQPDLISIGAGTLIEPGVLIQGPCVIGSNCIIRQGAYIRANTILGDHVVIGHTAEIKGSIILDRAAATHFVYVGDSIVGNDVNLGAGVKCANLRLDRREVRVLWENVPVQTGLKKLGAIIGDKVQIGCNSVLNPGTLVGKNTACHPLVTLSGTIAAGSMVSSDRMMHVESQGKRLLEKMGRH